MFAQVGSVPSLQGGEDGEKTSRTRRRTQGQARTRRRLIVIIAFSRDSAASSREPVSSGAEFAVPVVLAATPIVGLWAIDASLASCPSSPRCALHTAGFASYPAYRCFWNDECVCALVLSAPVPVLPCCKIGTARSFHGIGPTGHLASP
jgi:hypothetical protein